MNGIDTIIRRIEEAAQGEVDRILAQGKAEAEEISAGYAAQLRREAADLTAKGEKAAQERGERLVSAAQMEARKGLLAARQEMMEAAYARALERLCSLPREEYIQVLADLLVQAAPQGRGEVIFSPVDRDWVGAGAVDRANELLKGSLTLSPETRSMGGGFILRDERVEVNCAFDTLVRLSKADTAGAVAGILFP